MAKTTEGFVNFVGDNKKGGGRGMFVQGVDGWVRIAKSADDDGIVKGAKVMALIGTKNGEAFASKVKVLAAPRAGGGGGGRGGGGGGYKKDPAVQRSIVMQHSQEMAVRFLEILVEQGAIKLGASNKPEVRKLALEVLIDEQTLRFYTQAAEDGAEEFAAGSDEEDTEADDFDVDDEEETDDDEGKGWDDD